MSKNLVIVESPAKAKTITKYLNSNNALKHLGKFMVVASFGHVRDLKKKDLGIDINNNFAPDYQITEDKKKVVADIKKHAADATMIWLASDYDREGEAIAMHLKEVLKLKNYKRITFTEITSKALENAVMNPRKIDDNLVSSQETRRILDRLVGFKLSPLLWKKFTTDNFGGLSAGRVQSAAMHIILEREHEINNFKSESYWYFMGSFMMKLGGDNIPLEEVRLYKDNNMHKETDKKNVTKLLSKIKNNYKITDVNTKETKKNPDKPFITSSLQQEAYNKFGFPLKRTMQIAQELYEKGYITYMRTDSYNISDDFKVTAEQYIKSNYGDQYFGGAKKVKAQKNAQEAHEAIRPTQVDIDIASMDIGPDHKKLYEFIWKRTVAYFMAPCISDELTMKIVDDGISPLYFLSTFTKVKFNGFMVLYEDGKTKKSSQDYMKYIKNIHDGNYTLKCDKVLAKNTWSSPPARYNESSIVKILESESIGRPSTYSSILSKLFDKKYIIKSDISGINKEIVNILLEKGKIKEEKSTVTIGQERTRIIPTEIGKAIDEFLSKNFSYIVDRRFTASMESDLDKIGDGSKNRLEVLNGFWNVFGKNLKEIEGIKEKKTLLKTASIEHDIKGIKYIVRIAKYGPVIEYSLDNEKKQYINLKPFLKQYKKELNDVTADDIIFLRSLPKKLGNISGKPYEFVYGPYGFYAKYDGNNLKLSPKIIANILKDEYTDEDLKSSIEYNKAKKANVASTSTTSAKTQTNTKPKKIIKKK